MEMNKLILLLFSCMLTVPIVHANTEVVDGWDAACNASVYMENTAGDTIRLMKAHAFRGSSTSKKAANIARDDLKRCAFDLWDNRWENFHAVNATLPASCHAVHIASAEANVIKRLRRNSCILWGVRNATASDVKVKLQTYGNSKGCGGSANDFQETTTISDSYTLYGEHCDDYGF